MAMMQFWPSSVLTSPVLVLAILLQSVSSFCYHQRGFTSVEILAAIAIDLQSFRVKARK